MCYEHAGQCAKQRRSSGISALEQRRSPGIHDMELAPSRGGSNELLLLLVSGRLRRDLKLSGDTQSDEASGAQLGPPTRQGHYKGMVKGSLRDSPGDTITFCADSSPSRALTRVGNLVGGQS